MSAPPSTPPAIVLARRPTLAEEIVHASSHGVGFLLAVGVLVSLVGAAAASGDAIAIGAAGVFGASLVFVYLSSTVYHATPHSLPAAKATMQIVDHVAIHFLIAGTYTPMALCAIGGTWGAALCTISWLVAALGVVVETTSLRRSTRLSIAVYLGAGWLGLAAIPLLYRSAPLSLLLLALGGLAYTAGVPFFLAATRRWTHALWHAFVLAGSALHVAAIALVVLPA